MSKLVREIIARAIRSQLWAQLSLVLLGLKIAQVGTGLDWLTVLSPLGIQVALWITTALAIYFGWKIKKLRRWLSDLVDDVEDDVVS